MDKVSAVLTEDFLEKNKDLKDVEEIFAAVVAEDPSITREEFDLYAETLQNSPTLGEISEADLEDVSGGGALGRWLLVNVLHQYGKWKIRRSKG